MGASAPWLTDGRPPGPGTALPGHPTRPHFLCAAAAPRGSCLRCCWTRDLAGAGPATGRLCSKRCPAGGSEQGRRCSGRAGKTQPRVREKRGAAGWPGSPPRPDQGSHRTATRHRHCTHEFRGICGLSRPTDQPGLPRTSLGSNRNESTRAPGTRVPTFPGTSGSLKRPPYTLDPILVERGALVLILRDGAGNVGRSGGQPPGAWACLELGAAWAGPRRSPARLPHASRTPPTRLPQASRTPAADGSTNPN